MRSLQVEHHAGIVREVRVVPELLHIAVLVRRVLYERPLKLLPFSAGLELRANQGRYTMNGVTATNAASKTCTGESN